MQLKHLPLPLSTLAQALSLTLSLDCYGQVASLSNRPWWLQFMQRSELVTEGKPA